MSLQPSVIPPIPEETVRVAQAAFPKGNLIMRMRDEVGVLYSAALFASLFAVRGQPAEPPWRLALVTILQFVEGLSDQQAAAAVRSRLDGKYALSLELTDTGFASSILCEFRGRLVAGAAEAVLLDTMLDRFRALKLLAARGQQRTDSTHVLAKIRALNRLECVGETLRHALNTLALVAPTWLRVQVDPAWIERYASRFDGYRLPRGEGERQALAATIGTDGCHVLTASSAPTAPGWLREVPAVQVLRRIWVQQFVVGAGNLRQRTAEELPPAAQRITSPYDPDARFSQQRATVWCGYKVHLTETCDAERPHLITQVATTPATTQDTDLLPPIHQALADKDLLPQTHLVDMGYIGAELLVSSQRDYGVEVLGPVREDYGWHARCDPGFEGRHFAVDWVAQQVTCPAGCTSTQWTPSVDPRGQARIKVAFARHDCTPCAQRQACTKAVIVARTLTLRPQEQYEALQAARQRQGTEEFKQRYALRAGIEGTLSQGTRAFGLRRSRYAGQTKTHLQHILTGAALNYVRVGHWLIDPRRATTRRSPFVTLMTAAA
jgi:transposase